MSHELRTPLGAILGFAQLMESGVAAADARADAQHRSDLKAGWYLLELINEILDLALIESGKLSMSLEAVSLAEVMCECETMIEPQAQKHGISVSFPLRNPCFVNADRTRVKQVLINLLSNAIKYNNGGGTVPWRATRAVRRPCVSASGIPARGSIRNSLRSFSSRSIVSARRQPLKAPASAWWYASAWSN
jgi:signal transduction histidine kinase